VRPHHDLLLDPHDFDGLIGQNYQRVVQTRRIQANLAGADPFERQGDFLGGRMDEAEDRWTLQYCLKSQRNTREVWPVTVQRFRPDGEVSRR
jgi:hypothetical protein